MKSSSGPADVGAYIARCPKELRGKLRTLRATIKKAAPTAEERLSYGMPYYHYHGRLAYFKPAKAHIGLYIPPPVIQDHAKDLIAYGTSRATIRLPLNRKLPVGLIRKLIRARMKVNEARLKK